MSSTPRDATGTMADQIAHCPDGNGLSRRDLLAGGAASLALWGYAPQVRAARSDPRFLTVILRGAMDGLALAAPVNDPAYQDLRGPLALPAIGAGGALPLNDGFGLNPAMPVLHELYRKRQALIVHAVATPYRKRSHFDGQDVLESGLPGVGKSNNGWLNRAMTQLETARSVNTEGLSMGPVMPLIMRGPARVMSWSPKILKTDIDQSTAARLLDLYSETDPKLAAALNRGLEAEALTKAEGMSAAPRARVRMVRDMLTASQAAAKLMSSADGPRIGALAVSGWDTHANEGVMRGRLHRSLAGLDRAIKLFAEGMGPAWNDTVVAIITEFGRTARVNGTGGSDHGTGSAVILLGGGVRGGRVVTDWPGLDNGRLYQGRDLNPTTDMRSVLKGILGDHLGVSNRALAETVFPGSRNVRALGGLVA